ncbi:sterol desaturase family protein [Humisphaera borealis]|uniref:Sterol desaturase family protein n=1 Tax=Humisphaera borealis TaxID=2807512 RepID=A0A7M2WR99_9BACT|nr:sterol desaturase family protein [Humisphaera borealis]QOV88038.1 sterol desaturase family protein [Humisphaera borealis]
MPIRLEEYASMSWQAATFWISVINVIQFAAALIVGELLIRLYRSRPVTPPPKPLEAIEVVLAIACLVLNIVVGVTGWLLWRAGWIRVSAETGWRVVLDVIVLLIAMDLAMYVFHRIAHHPLLYGPLHSAHHKYDNPRPLDLFVLNPVEVLGFGALWIGVLMLYPATWIGIIVFLTLNLIFGTLGHLGVEPFPASWSKLPVVRFLGSSTFHADHHLNGRVNYGFYSNIWDRLFGTAGPR